MPYTTEEIVQPFWAEYSNTAGGRDPLAIQNSSVVIYSKMVVGITNVTNRIRYNGFYCWIFETILKHVDKKNSLEAQIRYTRRAELLLAYLMVKNFPDITGVSGSAYATNNLRPNISLKEGADWEYKNKSNSGLYWQFVNGVFGQYYSGAVRDLNLISPPDSQTEPKLNIYTVREKGRELAKGFEDNIPIAERELFWKSVSNGSIQESDLINLKSFALHQIPEDSNEHRLYEQIVLAADNRKIEPTFYRSETIKLILSHLIEQNSEVENLVNSFLKANYCSSKNKSTLPENVAVFWYLFEINELIHVAFEHFHACFLYFIEKSPTLLEQKIQALTEEVTNAFKEECSIKAEDTILQFSNQIENKEVDVYLVYNEMIVNFNSYEFGKCLMYAIKTILLVEIDCRKQISQLEALATAPQNNLNRAGYAVDLINEFVICKRDLTIQAYVKDLLLKAINLHTFSSYSKTKIGQGLVHNYIIEDYFVWRLRETVPSRTTPRLQNVIQYIIDIGWVRKEGKNYTITERGNKIIDKT